MKDSINKDLMNLSHAASKFFDEQPKQPSPLKLSPKIALKGAGHRRYQSNQVDSLSDKQLLPAMTSFKDESKNLELMLGACSVSTPQNSIIQNS